MKHTHKFILLILSLILTSPVNAQLVDPSIAKTVATTKIKNLGNSDKFQLLSNPELFYDSSKNPLFFAFQLEPVGYIIVSANQFLPPIVAYSFKNNYKSM